MHFYKMMLVMKRRISHFIKEDIRWEKDYR